MLQCKLSFSDNSLYMDLSICIHTQAHRSKTDHILTPFLKSKQKLTDGRDCCDDLAKLELVEDSCLTSCIKTNHQNSHFLLGKKPTEKLCERKPHSLSLPRNPYVISNMRSITIATKIERK